MEVVVFTGACGVGKSSTAKEWAKRKSGAVVEGDYFSNSIYKNDFPKWTVEEERFIANLSVVNALEYLKNGISVAVNYVWTPVGVQILVDKLSKEKSINSLKIVYLYCNLKENHKRDEQRILSHQMKNRVDIVNKELASFDWQDFVLKIDTSYISISKVCDLIDKSKV